MSSSVNKMHRQMQRGWGDHPQHYIGYILNSGVIVLYTSYHTVYRMSIARNATCFFFHFIGKCSNDLDSKCSDIQLVKFSY